MGLLDELKRIARPYEDEEDDNFDDFDTLGTGRVERNAMKDRGEV